MDGGPGLNFDALAEAEPTVRPGLIVLGARPQGLSVWPIRSVRHNDGVAQLLERRVTGG